MMIRSLIALGAMFAVADALYEYSYTRSESCVWRPYEWRQQVINCPEVPGIFFNYRN